jgi:type II secretory pathway pseudopilin PulG
MKRRTKFGLALIAMFLVLIVAAFAIPCMMPPHGPANESSAVANLRTINDAEETYRGAYGGYADSLTKLGGPQPCVASAATACLIDSVLANGVKSGYRFTVVASSPVGGANRSYFASAAPLVFGGGKRRFCSTEAKVIRVDSNAGRSTIPPDAQECANFSTLQ